MKWLKCVSCIVTQSLTPRYTLCSASYYTCVTLLRCMLTSKYTLMKCVSQSGRYQFNFTINLISTTLLLLFVVLNLSGGKMDHLFPYRSHKWLILFPKKESPFIKKTPPRSPWWCIHCISSNRWENIPFTDGVYFSNVCRISA